MNNDYRSWLTGDPGRRLGLVLMGIGAIMMYSQQFVLVGSGIGIIGALIVIMSRRVRVRVTELFSLGQRAKFILLILAILIAGTVISLLLPQKNSLNLWIGRLIVFIGVAFLFWFSFFRRRNKNND